MTRCISCLCEYNEMTSPACPSCGFNPAGYMHDAACLRPGTTVGGRYVLGKRADYDRCGYSITYAAWDTQTGSRVSVVEFYPREFVSREQVTGMLAVSRQDLAGKLDVGKKSFISEAAKLRKLYESDKRILRVLDCFPERNTAYMVTEYLEGQTLEQYVLSRKKMDYPEVAATFREVLGSLSTLHAGGIIHKYICPKNIFLCSDGRVVLINFGAYRSGIAESSSSVAATLEIGYAPYEQYSTTRQQGKSVDIYAVGACMYFALTGQRPPAATDRIDQDPLKPVNKVVKGVPQNTAFIIMNALNIKPENRPRQITEFIHAIEGKGRVVRKKERLKKEKVALPKWLVPVMAVLALAVTGVIVWLGMSGPESEPTPEGMVQVPSVNNMSIEQAEDMLADSELSMVISGRIYDDYLEKNTVLTQSPHPGSLAYSGSTVEVIASAPSQKIVVPGVTGMLRDAAKTEMENAGLTVSFEEIEDGSAQLNAVVSQSVEASAEVTVGTEVVLTVNIKDNSIQPEPDTTVLVPALVNISYSNASQLATHSGLNLIVEKYEYSSTVPENAVISQNPAPDTQVNQGAQVTVVVSKGIETIPAPDLQFISEDQARSVLSGKNLSLDVRYENSQSVASGLIIRQSPEASTQLQPGATITVYISAGNPVTVPNVVGSSQMDAQNALLAAGLACQISFENSDTVSAGLVIRQSAKGNTQLEAGTAVTITVSSGARTVEVTGVSLNSSTLSLRMGASATLYASVVPSNATNTSVTWSSSNESVAIVSSGGLITALGTGSTVITVTTNSGSYQATCTVTVTPNTTWSGWSGWSETYPEGHDEVESKTQYRAKTTEYTTGPNSTMSGYTLRTDINNPDVSYGNWSAWSTTPISSSSTVQAENRTVEISPATKKYTYFGYIGTGTSKGTYPHFCDICGKRQYGGTWSYREVTLDYEVAGTSWYEDSGGEFSIMYCAHTKSLYGECHEHYDIDGKRYYWKRIDDVPAVMETQYRYRDIKYTYHFVKETEWSAWSDTPVNGTQTETREVYRYRDLVEIPDIGSAPVGSAPNN